MLRLRWPSRMLCHSAVGRKCVPCSGRGGRCALKDASPTEFSQSFPCKTGMTTILLQADYSLRRQVETRRRRNEKCNSTRQIPDYPGRRQSKESCRFLGGYLTTAERYRWFGRTRPASPRFDLARDEVKIKHASLSCAYGQKLVRKQKCVGLKLTRISGRN